jgi:hypothetical protein
VNPHEDHAAKCAARNEGFLRRIVMPDGWTLFQVPDEPETWDQAEEDRETGVGIRPDDRPTEWDELERAFPVPRPRTYPSMYGGYIPSGG